MVTVILHYPPILVVLSGSSVLDCGIVSGDDTSCDETGLTGVSFD